LTLANSHTSLSLQLITLKDGKVGVNFAGYHADAGLGGLLTGNSAHGGLSASAGTPWGSRAAAGLGGGLNGRTAGGAYAAAQANDEVGASAVLGGSVGEHGYIGAESHRPGKTSGSSAQITPQHLTAAPVPLDDQPAVLPTRPTYVQRVKPPKKYSLIAPSSDHSAAGEINENHVQTAAVATAGSVQIVREQTPMPVIIVKRPRLRVKLPRQRQRTNVYVTQLAQPQPDEDEDEETVHQVPVPVSSHSDEPTKHSSAKTVATSKTYVQRPQVQKHVVAPQVQGNVVGSALEIPIGILRSLQVSLGNLAGGGVQQVPQAPVLPYQG
ncbi:hypothetical protein KR215_001424, partial [Drosophila sulfurigaster]